MGIINDIYRFFVSPEQNDADTKSEEKQNIVLSENTKNERMSGICSGILFIVLAVQFVIMKEIESCIKSELKNCYVETANAGTLVLGLGLMILGIGMMLDIRWTAALGTMICLVCSAVPVYRMINYVGLGSWSWSSTESLIRSLCFVLIFFIIYTPKYSLFTGYLCLGLCLLMSRFCISGWTETIRVFGEGPLYTYYMDHSPLWFIFWGLLGMSIQLMSYVYSSCDGSSEKNND